jgi:hypothetical protein
MMISEHVIAEFKVFKLICRIKVNITTRGLILPILADFGKLKSSSTQFRQGISLKLVLGKR